MAEVREGRGGVCRLACAHHRGRQRHRLGDRHGAGRGGGKGVAGRPQPDGAPGRMLGHRQRARGGRRRDGGGRDCPRHGPGHPCQRPARHSHQQCRRGHQHPVHQDVTSKAWHDTLAVNLTGAFYGCRHVLGAMMARRRAGSSTSPAPPGSRATLCRGLLRRQARRRRPHPGAGARGGRARGHRQRGLPRLYRHAAGCPQC
jgi:hypothetical protein